METLVQPLIHPGLAHARIARPWICQLELDCGHLSRHKTESINMRRWLSSYLETYS